MLQFDSALAKQCTLSPEEVHCGRNPLIGLHLDATGGGVAYAFSPHRRSIESGCHGGDFGGLSGAWSCGIVQTTRFLAAFQTAHAASASFSSGKKICLDAPQPRTDRHEQIEEDQSSLEKKIHGGFGKREGIFSQ